LSDGYLTKLADGRTYGEALLAPSVIYVKLIAQLFAAGIVPNYAVHVTGHGWRKLMRAVTPMVYRITNPGEPGALFDLLREHAKLDAREMYGTFNMGIGFALYVPKGIAPRVIAIANACGYNGWLAGEVVKDGDRKAVEIPSIDLRFESDSLKVR
jgi:phosphoribosylformylglycinamidine cyclo-ligase